jgi:hypothetical protein
MTNDKGQSVEPRQANKEVLRWTDDMDKILLNALLEEANKGNRHDGLWTTEAYSNVVDVLRSEGPPTMTKQHIKNRMKTMKDHFAESYDLFGSLSGFSWNSITRRFEAEEEVWKDLIRVSIFFVSFIHFVDLYCICYKLFYVELLTHSVINDRKNHMLLSGKQCKLSIMMF